MDTTFRIGPVLDELGIGSTLTIPPGQGHPSDEFVAADGADLGRFETGRELGRGGMGRVVEARDPDLRRRVAAKLLFEGEVNAQRLARFVAEAQITSQLEHPNIVPVHELGVAEDGRIYFVMRTAQIGPN